MAEADKQEARPMLSEKTKERLFNALIGLIVALTAYYQSKQTQHAVKQTQEAVQQSEASVKQRVKASENLVQQTVKEEVAVVEDAVAKAAEAPQ